MTDPLLSYPLVTVIFVLVTMINSFLIFDESRYNWRRISTKKIAVYTSCILYIAFAVILIQIPDYSSDFLTNISFINFTKNGLYDFNYYAPAYLVFIDLFYPLLSFNNAIFVRVMNLGFFAILQFLIYKIGVLVQEKNKSLDYKITFSLLSSSPFIILNVILVEGIELFITVVLVFGVFMLLKNHAFLAGLIFGYLTMVQFTYFLYFIGLVWYISKKKNKKTILSLISGGIPVLAAFIVAFSFISYGYVLNSFGFNREYALGLDSNIFSYPLLRSLPTNLNFLGIFLNLFVTSPFYKYGPPPNLLSLVLFLICLIFLRGGSSSTKQLVDIFILGFFFTIETSFFSLIVILSLVCIGTSYAKKNLKNFYINLNILYFLQMILLYFQTLPENNPFYSLSQNSIVMYCFILLKIVYIDFTLFRILRLSAPMKIIENSEVAIKISA